MSDSEPTNPMDDAKLAKDPIASRIPQGKSYWLMVLALMAAAGFWQYYLTYHYLPSKPIQWKSLTVDRVQNSLTVGRPVLVWIVDLKPNETATLLSDVNKVFQTNPDPTKELNPSLDTKSAPLVKNALPLVDQKFKVPFHQKGGTFLLGSTENQYPGLEKILNKPLKIGFYYLDPKPDTSPAYFPNASDAIINVIKRFRTKK